MSLTKTPAPVMWFMGATFSDRDALEQCLEQVKQKYGPLDYISKAINFEYTGYYRKEMGSGLLRHFISLREFGDPGELIAFKLYTNQLEAQTMSATGRRVNLDPGYLNMSHLILASCKPAPHRPYLGQGVYADLTLVYECGKFKAFPWTYPEYAEESLKSLMARLREDYKHKLKEDIS